MTSAPLGAVEGALLVAEVGTALTRVTLVDLVDDMYRLVARAEMWSTHAAPSADASSAIRDAFAEIEATTGRRLQRDGRLIQPTDNNGDGVHGLLVTTSAAGTLPVLIFALSTEGSARAAAQAARSTYTRVIRTFALSEAGAATGDWLNRQIVQLAQSRPGAIIIAGGMDNGAATHLERLAAMARLVAQQQTPPPPLIFAGSSAGAAQVKSALDPATQLIEVENLRPTQDQARLEPTRGVLRQLYAERYLPQLPGTQALGQMKVDHVSSVAAEQGLMTRFLSERFNRNILTLDMGAQTTAALLHSDHHYSEAIYGACGTHGGALPLVAALGAEAVTRWLPFEIDADDLENRLLNRALAPAHVPADLDDLLLDHALLREGLRMAVGALRDERPGAPVDLVLAGGALSHTANPGLAALTLLDALELDGARMPLAVDLYLDLLGLLPVSGALAHTNADAAVCLIEQDGLNNGPLATVVVPHGVLQGQVAEVELTPVGGAPVRAVVEAGTIVRLPLPRGQKARLRIQPSAKVAIGPNAPGAEVLSNEAAIAGSALGVIVDARPRPLALPAAFAERRLLLLGHLRALDALPTADAYDGAGQPTASQPVIPAQPAASNGTIVPVAPVTNASERPAEDDLAALRKELVTEAPPKRGLFRSKK